MTETVPSHAAGSLGLGVWLEHSPSRELLGQLGCCFSSDRKVLQVQMGYRGSVGFPSVFVKVSHHFGFWRFVQM